MKCAEPIKKLNNVKLSPELLKLKSVIDKSSDENIKNISNLNINNNLGINNKLSINSIIIIRYSNNIIKKIELTEIEVFILKAAVLYNRGFINLLSMKKTRNK